MKSNVIIHVTTSCNFQCSYCDVVKDKKQMSQDTIDRIILNVSTQKWGIGSCKFFGGEPTLHFQWIKKIIEGTKQIVGKHYEIVTNTSFLNDEMGTYFQKYFQCVFFSVDSENTCNLEKVIQFIHKFDLFSQAYINLIVSPGKTQEALSQFEKLLSNGISQFNILPVYFTQAWSYLQLKDFSQMMKKILHQQIAGRITLYWFQKNEGYYPSLVNDSFFVDVDGKVYFSDFVSTFYWNVLKQKLYLGEIQNFDFSSLSPEKIIDCQKAIQEIEAKILKNVSGQKELHRLMDYYSHYLNVYAKSNQSHI